MEECKTSLQVWQSCQQDWFKLQTLKGSLFHPYITATCFWNPTNKTSLEILQGKTLMKLWSGITGQRHTQGPCPYSQHKDRIQAGRRTVLHQHLIWLCPRCCHMGDSKVIPQTLCAGYILAGKTQLQQAKAHYLQTHCTPPAGPWLGPACTVPRVAVVAHLSIPHLPPCTMGKPWGNPGRLSPWWTGHWVLQNAPFIKSCWVITNKSEKNYLNFLVEEMKLQSQWNYLPRSSLPQARILFTKQKYSSKDSLMKLFKLFHGVRKNKDSSDLPLLSKAESIPKGVNFFLILFFCWVTPPWRQQLRAP